MNQTDLVSIIAALLWSDRLGSTSERNAALHSAIDDAWDLILQVPTRQEEAARRNFPESHG